MTPELLTELSRFPLFPKTAADLVRVAGIEGAAALIAAWPGQRWPVPTVVGGSNAHGAQRYAHLEEIVGAAAAKRIVAWCGGGELIVPNLKTVLRQRNQERIRAEFDVLIKRGHSAPEAVFALGVAYGFTATGIERIVRRPDVELKPALGQACLF